MRLSSSFHIFYIKRPYKNRKQILDHAGANSRKYNLYLNTQNQSIKVSLTKGMQKSMTLTIYSQVIRGNVKIKQTKETSKIQSTIASDRRAVVACQKSPSRYFLSRLPTTELRRGRLRSVHRPIAHRRPWTRVPCILIDRPCGSACPGPALVTTSTGINILSSITNLHISTPYCKLYKLLQLL